MIYFNPLAPASLKSDLRNSRFSHVISKEESDLRNSCFSHVISKEATMYGFVKALLQHTDGLLNYFLIFIPYSARMKCREKLIETTREQTAQGVC